MRICLECERNYHDTITFCRYCGSPLLPEQAATPEAIAERKRFEERIANEPDNRQVYIEYAHYLISVDFGSEAAVQLSQALSLKPSDTAVRDNLLHLYEELEDWEHAAALLSQEIETSPEDHSPRMRLANILSRTGQQDRAAGELAKIIEARPDDRDAQVQYRDVLVTLKRFEDLIPLCSRLVESDATDIDSWRALGESFLAIDKLKQATRAFDGVLRLDRTDARALLYVGIGHHNAAAKGQVPSYATATSLLEMALQKESELAKTDVVLAQLYLTSAKIRSGTDPDKANDILLKLHEQGDCITGRHRTVLARCWVSLGDTHFKNKKFDQAIWAYRHGLTFEKAQAIQDRIAEASKREAESFMEKRRFGKAAQIFAEGLESSPENAALKTLLTEARGKGRRRTILRLGAVSSVLALGALGYYIVHYGQGALTISVGQAADIKISSGDTAILATEDPSTTLTTELLRYGTYRVHAEKEGYRTIDEDVTTPFGRKTKRFEIPLEPIYGALKVESDPPGATVVVTNKYEQKKGTTPCVIDQLFALESSIKISHTGFISHETKQSIADGGTLDLGKIVFAGSVRIDSDPSGADVIINGEIKGKTPVLLENLPAKQTTLVVRKENVGIHTAHVLIAPQQAVELGTVTLSNLGALVIQSDPENAAVWLDGKRVGATPLTVNNVETGDHNVRIVVPDCVPYETVVQVETGNMADLGTVVFKGSLKLDSDPPGAEIYIEGEKKGVAPMTLEGLLAKDTRYELRVPGKGSFASTVRITPQELTDLGTVRIANVSGKWTGILDSNNEPVTFFIKEAADNSLHALGVWSSGCVNYTGAREGNTFSLKGAQSFWKTVHWSFSGTLSNDGQIVQGKFRNRDNESESNIKFQRGADSSDDYVLPYNENLRYFVKLNDVDDESLLTVNSALIARVPNGKSTGWVDLTPMMRRGDNRIRVNHNQTSGSRWHLDFALKTVNADGREQTVISKKMSSDNDRTRGQKYRISLVVPYFDNDSAVAEWKRESNTETYVEVVRLNPVAAEASSQYGSRYAADKIYDVGLNTAWISAKDKTVGEWIRIDYGNKVRVHGLRLFNGLQDNSFGRSGLLKKARVKLGEKEITLEVKNDASEQYFPLDAPVFVDEILLSVDAAYPGRSDKNVAISHFEAVTLRSPNEETPESSLAKSLLDSTWEGEYRQPGHSPYPMIFKISGVDGATFSGTLGWPSLRNSLTKVRGEILSGSRQVRFTEYELLRGGGVVLPYSYEGTISGSVMQGKGGVPPSSTTGSGPFTLKRKE